MFHATELYGQNDRLFSDSAGPVSDPDPFLCVCWQTSEMILTAYRRAGLPVRPSPAQDARLLACISTPIWLVP